MKVVHISTEFYPAAKAGGLGDVVGALPIYQSKIGMKTLVVLPKYDLPWFADREYQTILNSSIVLGDKEYAYSILSTQNYEGVDLLIIDVPLLFDRPSIYLDVDGEGYDDEAERNISFQKIALEYLNDTHESVDVIHCHDHQTGLIPFYIKYDQRYGNLSSKVICFTIHNGQYQGQYDWSRRPLLEPLPEIHAGELDWDGVINSMATGVKCADLVTTVSPSYLEELKNTSRSIRYLFDGHGHKCHGVLNGIDHDSWNPTTDPFISYPLKSSWSRFKQKNKAALLDNDRFDKSLPTVAFIGRFAHQKGVDVLLDAIDQYLQGEQKMNFIILGSGDQSMERQLREIEQHYSKNIKAYITYNEKLAHQIYAAADFLVMPSRFEPCGLNQMFAMRYGTIPIVHNTGGLKDTVTSLTSKSGSGILFNNIDTASILWALGQAKLIHQNKSELKSIQNRIGQVDYSWTKSAKSYLQLYKMYQKQ